MKIGLKPRRLTMIGPLAGVILMFLCGCTNPWMEQILDIPAGPRVQAITDIALSVSPPVRNAVPDYTATVAGTGDLIFTIGPVSWDPDHNPFQASTVYTASLTLTVTDENHTFRGLTSPTINGEAASISDNTGTEVTLSYTFDPTEAKPVIDILIKTQPSKLTYSHGDALNLAGLVVTLIYDDYTDEDVALGKFEEKRITANPAHGAALSIPAHNGKPVVVSVVSKAASKEITLSAETDTLTVDIAIVSAITFPTAAPITYGEPLSASTLSGGSVSTLSGGGASGSFVWQNGAFIPSVPGNSYPVVFTPADAVNYDYSGIADWGPGTVIGYVPVRVNPAPITSAAVTVTAPVRNGIPDTTVTISGGGNFTAGSVSWSPAHNPFQADTVYTASLTLTVVNGNYTFRGLTSAKINGEEDTTFIVDNTGTEVTLSYKFPPTAPKPIISISIETQPTKLTYIHGEALDLSGLAVRVTYDDLMEEVFARANFGTKNITTNPAHGAALSLSTHNGQPVVVSVVSEGITRSANTNALIINKANGAPVGIPIARVAAAPSPATITVTPVTPPANGQTVEYAINTTTTAPSTGWQPGTIFNDSLNVNSTYYVFARSKENNDYNAGPERVSAPIYFSFTVTFDSNGGSAVPSQTVNNGDKASEPTPAPSAPNTGFGLGGWFREPALTNQWNFGVDTVTSNITLYAKWVADQTIAFEFDPDESPTATSGIIIYRSSSNGPTTATLTVSSGYTNIQWYYNNTSLGTGASLILNSANSAYNVIGLKFITVEAEKGGVPYSVIVQFEVKP